MKTPIDQQSDSSISPWMWLAALPFGLFVLIQLAYLEYPLPWLISWDWVSSLGIGLSFRIDAFSYMMLSLITGIGTFIFIYAAGYLSHTPDRHKIFIILPIFMLAMMGAVSADDVILLFVFWELTSLTSFLLVGFKHNDEKARDSARQALFITMGGGMALLGGLILLAEMAGSWRLSEIVAAVPNYQEDPRLTLAIVLVLLGAFTKSAQFPFHFWLPNAMSAPTPISAYLHSATMVKLGIYLMARLDTGFNDLLLWEVLLIGTGTITALWAALLTLRERDLKRILARSTVSALGTMTILIGLPSSSAGLALVVFLFTHAIYKAPLFMVAGNIDHATGTREIDKLMGLRRVMPWSALIAVVAGLSMAGLPMAFGFVAKDVIAISKEDSDLIGLVSQSLFLVSATAIAVAGVAAIRVFWGKLEPGLKDVKEVHWSLFLPPLMIALIGIEFELFPDLIEATLIAAAKSISPDLAIQTLSSPYTFENMFSSVGLTLLVGVLLFLAWDKIHSWLSQWHWIDRFGPEAAYEGFLSGLKRVAAAHTRFLQSGKLNVYSRLVIGTLLVAISLLLLEVGFRVDFEALMAWDSHGWAWLVAGMFVIIGAVGAILAQGTLSILLLSGLVGYGAAIIFLFSGAPDLAFTQFMMETILVVVAASVLPYFKNKTINEPISRDVIRLLLAVSAGLITFVLLLSTLNFPENTLLKDWFSANSWGLANGRNVVNVIIVDFRAMDTFGEIAVVALGLVAAWPLLKKMQSQPNTIANTIANAPSQSILLSKVAVVLYWIMLLFAVIVLFRGHNEPGGGFIGGLIAVAASSLLAIIKTPSEAKRLQVLAPLQLALFGVLLALFAGVLAGLLGEGFLRHYWWNGLSTVMLFDLGVFLVVWGGFTGYVYALLPDASPNLINSDSLPNKEINQTNATTTASKETVL